MPLINHIKSNQSVKKWIFKDGREIFPLTKTGNVKIENNMLILRGDSSIRTNAIKNGRVMYKFKGNPTFFGSIFLGEENQKYSALLSSEIGATFGRDLVNEDLYIFIRYGGSTDLAIEEIWLEKSGGG